MSPCQLAVDRGIGFGPAKDTELLTKAVAVLLEAEEWGEDVPLDLVWAAIEKAVGPRERLRAALARVQDAAPPPGPSPDPAACQRLPVADTAAARLSAYQRRHILYGTYSFDIDAAKATRCCAAPHSPNKITKPPDSFSCYCKAPRTASQGHIGSTWL